MQDPKTKRKIHGHIEFDSIAFVKNPPDKRCRIHAITCSKCHAFVRRTLRARVWHWLTCKG